MLRFHDGPASCLLQTPTIFFSNSGLIPNTTKASMEGHRAGSLHSVSLHLFRRCFFVLFRPLIVSRLPSFIRIVAIHLFKGLQRLRSEVLLIHDPVRTDNESLHSRNSMLSRRCRQGEPADHGAFHDEIHLAHWSSWPLTFQHFEIVAMIRLTLIAIALLQGVGDILPDGTSPGAIRILPGQAIMFAGSADYPLGVLIYLRIVMLLLSIFMLCFHKPPTDRDGIEFVSADAAI